MGDGKIPIEYQEQLINFYGANNFARAHKNTSNAELNGTPKKLTIS